MLGAALADQYATRADLLVLGLPRGGVPVAHGVAVALAAPLDVFVVRKLGLPGHEELAMGAIASGGVRVMNRDVLDYMPVSDRAVEDVVARELRELERRERAFRGDQSALDVRDHTVIVVDDGLATASTSPAALTASTATSPRPTR